MKRTAPKKEVVNKTFLYNDITKYNAAVVIENKGINAIEKLTLIADASIGEGSIKDYTEFLSNPMNYLVEGYWNKYGQKYNAPNSNRLRVFLTSTGIKATDVEFYAKQYNDSVKALGSDLSPILEGKKFDRSVTMDKFNVFVSEAKNESYEATLNLIEAINKYKETMPVSGGFHLARFTMNTVKHTGELDMNKFI